jgi:predicted RNase H-like nuclease (RuvC/YqgF family)
MKMQSGSRNVKALQQENRRLTQQIEELKDAHSDLRALQREVKELRKRNGDADSDRQGELIRELRSRIAAYEVEIRELQRVDFEPVLRRIEIVLERFPVEGVARAIDGTVAARLDAILSIIYLIRELFDEQRKTGDRRIGRSPR